MPRPCSLCIHPERKAVDRAILDGESFRHMATRFDTSTGALQRHKAHVAATVEKAHARREQNLGESLLEKLSRLEQRLEVLYGDAVSLLEKAKQSEDTQAGVRAVHAVRHVLSESRAQIEVLGELRGELDRRPQVSLQVLAPLLIQALAPCPIEVRVDVARRLQELDKTLQVDANGTPNG